MASAARLARNRRTVANVIALGQGDGVPIPPAGFVLIIDNDGAYLVDDDGAFLMEAI